MSVGVQEIMVVVEEMVVIDCTCSSLLLLLENSVEVNVVWSRWGIERTFGFPLLCGHM